MTNNFLLKNVSFFDGLNDGIHENYEIRIADGLIAEISKYPISVPTNLDTLDLKNLTVLPGLIDAHVHIGAVEVDFGSQARRLSSSLIAIQMLKRLEYLLDRGFTTARDAGGCDWGFKHAVAESLVRGPELMISNRMISQTGGHGDMRDRGESKPVGHDCSSHGMIFRVADGAGDVRRAVREQIRLGADFIKVMASGGAASPTDKLHQPQFSEEELRIIVEEAHMGGVYVAAHALPAWAISRAVSAGARTIEHGNLLDEQSAIEMAAAGTYLIPTVATYVMASRSLENYDHGAEANQKIIDAAEGALKSIELASKHKVKIGSGSDLLGHEISWLNQEFVLKSEIIGNFQTLKSATSINAEAINRSDIGSIEVGKKADLIAVTGNPLKTIEVLGSAENVQLVMKSGALVKKLSNKN
jgi:imidazolonepropionase-like amidohydrolase